jgi:phosphatidylglycerophosphate synthase
MPIHALIQGESPVKLWGLSARERLRRQLREAGGAELAAGPGDLPTSGAVLLLNGAFLFEVRTLSALLEKSDVQLKHPQTGSIAAVMTDVEGIEQASNCMSGSARGADGLLETVTPEDLAAFNETLKSAQAPLLEPVLRENQAELESRLYGNAYKGITDLVTKFVWPRPARKAVQIAAFMGMSPNMVTSIGLVLVIGACYLFLNGHYLAGLAAGWLMTFLDTVDGKLARVTVQSTKFGNLYDHIIDLVHPPFWYIYWGMSLTGFTPVLGFDQQQMYWLIIIAYVLGRLVEGVFPLLGNCGIFTWRPFDAWFRLVTARRNPCLIILTACALAGQPDWGFIAVTFWSVLTTLLLLLRLVQGMVTRLRGGPLDSWLSDENVANGPNAGAFRIFGSTRGAYGA